MIDKERKSNIDILYSTKVSEDKANKANKEKDTSETNFVASLDPVSASHDDI